LWLELGFDELTAGIMPSELTVAQMPRRFEVGEIHIEIEYKLTFVGDIVTNILMILSDVTNQVARLRSEQEQREMLNVFERIATDRSAVVEFVAETDHLMTQLAQADASASDVRRWIHTLKGNSAVFGLERLARTCHELESAIEETGGPMTRTQCGALGQAWQDRERRIKMLLGGDDKRTLQVTRVEYESCLNALEAGRPRADISTAMRAWTLEPTELRLLRIADQARSLAHRLAKGDIHVITESNGLRLPQDRFSAFWGAFVHLIRNAVDHGLETPDERLAAGKRASGTLTVRTFVQDVDLVVSIEDDGRGIDWARVASAARTRGLVHETRAELEALVFLDGLSTKETASELSGRGVGMGAVLSAVQALGGQLSLSSESGSGTRCVARFPRTLLEPARGDEVVACVA
jgi:two-component system, chemotaxis family, sensor kinase CheA